MSDRQPATNMLQLADTTDMDLRSLLEVLFRKGGIQNVKAFFTAHAYRVSQPPACLGTRFENTVIGIKYLDGVNNLWRPRWAREARGRFYYYDTDTRTVLVLKDTLQRGAEVLTHAHIATQVTETQDVINTFAHLDDVRNGLMKYSPWIASLTDDAVLEMKKLLYSVLVQGPTT